MCGCMGNMNQATDISSLFTGNGGDFIQNPNVKMAYMTETPAAGKTFIQNYNAPMAFTNATTDAMIAKATAANTLVQQQYATNTKTTTATSEPKTGALANIWLNGISGNVSSLAELVTAIKTPREQQTAQQPIVVASSPTAPTPDAGTTPTSGGKKTGIIVAVVVVAVLVIGYFAFKQG